MKSSSSQYPALGKLAKRKGVSTWKIGFLGARASLPAMLFVFLLSAFCLLPSAVNAQGVVSIRSGATVPANCTPRSNNGLFYKNSGANIGLHECTAANTWTYRGALNFGGTLTPTALSGDVNNYSPTNLASSFAIRINGGAADRNITGLATGSDGRLVLIINIGATNTLTLVDQSASSTAANRFLIGADLVLPINASVFLRYDGTSSRWRPVGQVLSNSGATAGSYGSATQVGTFIIGADGRITTAGNTTVTPAESSVTFTDITTGNVTSTRHGYTPKSPGDATRFLNGAATPAFAQVNTTDLATAVSGPLAGNGSSVLAATPNQVVAPLVCTDAGANDDYVCGPTPAATTYTNLTVIFTPNTANTGASTINVSAIGVKNIKKLVGGAVSDPDDNDFRAGGRYLLSYDGTQMLVVSLLGNAPPAAVTSINGDTTAAQIVAAGFGISVTDAGATHTIASTNVASYLDTTITYNNTATLADTALSVTVVTGGKYRIELIVHSTSAVTNLKMDFAGTATITNFVGEWIGYNAAIDMMLPSPAIGARVTAAGTDFGPGGAIDGADGYYVFTGSVEINVGGTFLLRAAQNAADASDTTLLRGSTLVLTKLN